MSATWFDKLSVEAQNDYCANLKGGKKKSKFCNIETGKPLAASERVPSKPKKASTKSAGSAPAPSPASTNESGSDKDHDYYDVKGDHSWAKKAEIKNLGEDIKGSARHKKNAHRDWGDLNAMSLNKDFTKKELLKMDQITSENIPEGHEIPFWVVKDILSKYPDEKHLKAEDKKLWIEKYQVYLAEGKRIATENRDPIVTAALFTTYLDAQGSLLGRANRGEIAIRYFARNAGRDLEGNNGALTKLKSIVPREKLSSAIGTEGRLKAVAEHLNNPEISKKIKEVIDGKPFLSTLTGEKAQVDRFDEAGVYKEIIMDRKGDNVFDNAEESGAYLAEAIGFKGVQFGNSLTDNERAEHLGHASHAFHDMAEAIEVDPKDISMNGRVSIGFGSRGVGGSKATYHPDHWFININRNNGYGALGHEWGHAYGFNIGDKLVQRKHPGHQKKYCFSELNDSIVKGTEYEPILKRLNDIKAKVRKRYQTSPDYRACSNSHKKWLWESAEIFARAFETYAAKKMEKKGKSNTYLVSRINAFGWPTDEEMVEYEGVFDDLLKIKDSFK